LFHYKVSISNPALLCVYEVLLITFVVCITALTHHTLAKEIKMLFSFALVVFVNIYLHNC